MIFEWDEDKNIQNRKKHGVWFEEAKTVFEDDLAKVFYDEEYSQSEDRFLIIGKSCFGKTLIIVHCYREEDEIIRIISARKTTKNEGEIYEKGI